MSKPNKKPTIKELSAGVVNNFNNLNLLANYINDFIQFKEDSDNFKVFLRGKYERLKNEQADRSNTERNRKNQPGDPTTDTKSRKTGTKTKKK